MPVLTMGLTLQEIIGIGEVTILPGVPTDLTVEYFSDTKVLVSWTYPVAGTYPIFDTKVIQDGVEFTSRNSSSLAILADANIAMDYSVYAVDTMGNVSPTSDIVTYTNVVIADIPSVYVSFATNNTYPPVGGETVNDINATTDTQGVALNDEHGIVTPISLAWTETHWLKSNLQNAVTGDDTGFLLDKQFVQYWYSTSHIQTTVTVNGLDASHTYEFKVSASKTSTVPKDTKFTMNSNDTIVDVKDNINNGATEASITGVTSFDILVDDGNVGDTRYLSGITINRKALPASNGPLLDGVDILTDGTNILIGD